MIHEQPRSPLNPDGFMLEWRTGSTGQVVVEGGLGSISRKKPRRTEVKVSLTLLSVKPRERAVMIIIRLKTVSRGWQPC